MAREDLVVARVVGDRGQQRDLVPESQGRNRWAFLLEKPTDEFACGMRSIAGAPAIAAKHDLAAPLDAGLGTGEEVLEYRNRLGEEALFGRDALANLGLDALPIHPGIKPHASRRRKQPAARRARIACLATVLLTLAAGTRARACAQDLEPWKRDALLIELLDRVRWPLRPQTDILWMVSPGDFDADGKSLALGARLWEARAEFVVQPAPQDRVSACLDGAVSLDSDSARRTARRFTLRLGADDETPFDLRFVVRIDAVAPQPMHFVERQLVARGYRRAAAVVVEFDNLHELFSDPSLQRAFVAGPLAARFRAASAARTTDPGPTRRGRDAWLESKGVDRRPRRIWHSREKRPAGLGFFSTSTDVDERERARYALLQEFVDGIRWPLPNAGADWLPFFRSDDLPGRLGLEMHDAIDCGALRSDDGKLGSYRAGTKLTALHDRARSVEALRSGSRAWRIDLLARGHRLSLWVGAYHLTASGGLAGWNGSTAPASWRTADPALRALGWPKGNHVHIEILGAFEDEARTRLWLGTQLRTALERAAGRSNQSEGTADDSDLAVIEISNDAAARKAAVLSRRLSEIAAAIPRLDRVCLIPGSAPTRDRPGTADRFELRGPPLPLPARFETTASGFVLELTGARLEIGPATQARPARLQPGELAVRCVLASPLRAGDPLGALPASQQKLLLARILRRVASIEASER